jgi:hypothetical protein
MPETTHAVNLYTTGVITLDQLFVHIIKWVSPIRIVRHVEEDITHL